MPFQMSHTPSPLLLIDFAPTEEELDKLLAPFGLKIQSVVLVQDPFCVGVYLLN
jgi:hypothetical protein